MRKMLLLVIALVFSVSVQVNASNWLGLKTPQSEVVSTEHSAIWWEGSISHEQFVACVENFTPPNNIGEVCSCQEGYNKFFCPHVDEFYYISLAFGLDPRYVFSLGIYESGYGSSDVVNSKNNLFALGSSTFNSNLAFKYISVSESIFDTCYLLNQYATEGSWQYQTIASMGYDPKTIEGQQALFGTDSTYEIISIMEEIFPAKGEIVVKLY